MAKKVVKLRMEPNGRVHNAEEVMNMIRMELYDYNVSDLSDMTMLSKSCFYAIKAGRTKWPRGSTLFTILLVLGYEMRIVRVRNSAMEHLGRKL